MTSNTVPSAATVNYNNPETLTYCIDAVAHSCHRRHRQNLNVESLTVSAVARVSYGVDAVGEGFRIVVVDTGGRWNVVTGHKESLPPIN